METVKKQALQNQPHLIEIRRALHQEPEVGGQEIKTAKIIAEELLAIGGFEVRENVGGYGVLADLKSKNKNARRVALRADMDALPVLEETGLPFSSVHQGVMHACGHDHHVTCLLGAARILSELGDEIPNHVRLIFQPSEEKSPIGGARGMIAEGALEGVDAVFGLHVWPDLPEGVLGVKEGPLMAASDHFVVHIKGKSAHGAMPHKGTDALVAGSAFVSAIQTIVSRNTDPLEPIVITIGLFRAGSVYNVISEDCVMEGTCRTFSPKVRDQAQSRLQEILNGICAAYGCTGEIDYQRGYGALINQPECADYMLQTWQDLFGKESVERIKTPAMTAEDFSFYLNEKPGAFAWLGTQAKDDFEYYPLHSCHFKGNENVLWKGAALLAALAMKTKEV